uniref:Uncharacterized protein n=1 Tax=Caulerpa lentillifera TaxID=148947 RepID=A0A345HH03_9CHLO|nr:hypothetical protein [Caulerpa lentillifera]AXG75893.1 hypothetical protein [Caulerpa lentillifera]QKS32288.1 hypothetical protein [Caulerpa lentillifera]QUV75641.1 hypothetical protein [Caulerpa lentillifera]
MFQPNQYMSARGSEGSESLDSVSIDHDFGLEGLYVEGNGNQVEEIEAMADHNQVGHQLEDLDHNQVEDQSNIVSEDRALIIRDADPIVIPDEEPDPYWLRIYAILCICASFIYIVYSVREMMKGEFADTEIKKESDDADTEFKKLKKEDEIGEASISPSPEEDVAEASDSSSSSEAGPPRFGKGWMVIVPVCVLGIALVSRLLFNKSQKTKN